MKRKQEQQENENNDEKDVENVPLFKVSGAGKFNDKKNEKKEEKNEQKKEKKNKKKKIDLKDEFANVYAKALYYISTELSFHEDSGCYCDALKTGVHREGDWTRIYQPGKDMKRYEDGVFYFIFRYRQPITPKEFKSFQPVIEKVNRIYLQSYNDVLKQTSQKWSIPISSGTFEEVSQMVKKPYLDEKGDIKMSFTIRGYENWVSNDWWDPVRLLCWIQNIDFETHHKDYILDENVAEKYKRYTCKAVEASL